MKEFNITVNDTSGIHARPAGILVKEASKYESEIKLILKDKIADGKRIFSVMGLAAKYGDKLKILVNGIDEDKAAEELQKFFKDYL